MARRGTSRYAIEPVLQIVFNWPSNRFAKLEDSQKRLLQHSPKSLEWLDDQTLRELHDPTFPSTKCLPYLPIWSTEKIKYTPTASAYAVAPVPPARRGTPSSGSPAATASSRMRSRASPTRSLNVVSATNWRSVNRSAKVVSPYSETLTRHLPASSVLWLPHRNAHFVLWSHAPASAPR